MSLYRTDENEFLTKRCFVDDFFSDCPNDESLESETIYARLMYEGMEPEEYLKSLVEAAKRYEKEQKLREYRATEVR
ncbi:MAG: hypothetical protein E7311_01135 [Clostridiales bacterium]|nr:hypothetical protein [Clostridiales bacterium]